MALPSSGSITIQMIATELGVSLPLDINASNVRTLAGVPTGNIIMPTHFYGKSNSDYIPTAVNWANISTTTSDGTGLNQGSNASQTISGVTPSINVTITTSNWLCYTPSGTGTRFSSAIFSVYKNGSFHSSVSVSKNASAQSKTLTVTGLVNTDTLHFVMEYSCSSIGGNANGNTTATFSVNNTSDGGTVLDTFTVTVGASYIEGY